MTRTWFGLSDCVWFALESTRSISDPDMIDLDSQPVRVLLSSPTTRFLTWHNWFGLSGCAWSALEHTGSVSDPEMVVLNFQIVRSLLSNLLVQFLTGNGLFWLLVCAWFALRFTHDAWPVWSLSLCVVYSRIYCLISDPIWVMWTLRLCVASSLPT